MLHMVTREKSDYGRKVQEKAVIEKVILHADFIHLYLLRRDGRYRDVLRITCGKNHRIPLLKCGTKIYYV